MTPKTKMLWDISKEQETLFMKSLSDVTISEWSMIDIEELFRMIRSAEYRRGKEE